MHHHRTYRVGMGKGTQDWLDNQTFSVDGPLYLIIVQERMIPSVSYCLIHGLVARGEPTGVLLLPLPATVPLLEMQYGNELRLVISITTARVSQIRTRKIAYNSTICASYQIGEQPYVCLKCSRLTQRLKNTAWKQHEGWIGVENDVLGCSSRRC